MDFRNFFSQHQGLQIKYRLQTIANIVMAICLCITCFLTYKASQSKRTVIVPSHINAALEVSDMDASPNFIRVNVVYALSLLYSYQPNSAATRFQEFLISYVERSKQKELRDMLADMLKKIQSVKVSQSLEIERYIFQKNVLLVQGKLFRYTLGNPIATEPIFLRIGYRILDGNLKIRSIATLTHADFNRIARREQIEGKKIEDEQKKREKNAQRGEQEKKREREKLDREGKAPEQLESMGEEFSDDEEPANESFGTGLVIENDSDDDE